MPRQHALPREAFLNKLNGYLAAHIAQTRGAGAKISRETIARQLGDYNRVTLYKWLSGSNSIPRIVVEKLCTLVGLSDEERRELLWLGGYIEGPAPSLDFQKRLETENEVYMTEIEDLQATISRIGEQSVTSSSDTSTLPSLPVPAAPTIAKPVTSGHIRRCIDLVANIREALELIKEYEDQQRLTDDPRIQRRAMRSIVDLRAQLTEYEREQRELGCK